MSDLKPLNGRSFEWRADGDKLRLYGSSGAVLEELPLGSSRAARTVAVLDHLIPTLTDSQHADLERIQQAAPVTTDAAAWVCIASLLRRGMTAEQVAKYAGVTARELEEKTL